MSDGGSTAPRAEMRRELHDLANALGAIVGLVFVLEEMVASGPEREVVADLKLAAGRLPGMLDRLRKLAG